MQINDLLNTIHDAEVLGINSESQSKVIVSLKTDQLCNIKLEFNGVEFFRFTDIIQQNIISRLIFLNFNEHTKTDIAYYLKWATSLTDSTSYLDKEMIDQIMDKIHSQELQIVYFEPSSGMESVVVFKQLQIINTD